MFSVAAGHVPDRGVDQEVEVVVPGLAQQAEVDREAGHAAAVHEAEVQAVASPNQSLGQDPLSPSPGQDPPNPSPGVSLQINPKKMGTIKVTINGNE